MTTDTRPLLTSPRLEILRDVYQTMNRRLEHYRQLAATTIFGTLALFVLVTNGISGWREKVAAAAPKTFCDGLPFAFDLAVLFTITALVVFFADRLIARAGRNFAEVTSILLKVETAFGLHTEGQFLPGHSLYPSGWPRFDGDAGGRPNRWAEDIIPLTRWMILCLGGFFALYMLALAVSLLRLP